MMVVAASGMHLGPAAVASAGLGLIISALFVYSGWTHGRDPKKFRAVVVQQQVLPFQWIRLAVAAVIIGEGIAAALGLVGVVLVVAGSGLAGWLFVPELLLLATFTIYLTVLVSRGTTAPCGCFGGASPASWLTVVRTGTLTIVITVVALLPGSGRS